MRSDPKISVVVTCYNYAHFLAPCLDSVLDQTAPAHEVIVVDDGSTDDSPTVLEAYANRATIIRTENGGQASAFNTGFAASTGDAVLFLDADDLLWPEALETIAVHWRPGLGHMSFGLETIDEVGQSIGIHPGSVVPCAGDNRPRLLNSGTFDFPPTSGNVFARDMLNHALPMPEARWRISADCFLIRASALFAPTGYIPHILGSYRIHGANNYARNEPGRKDAGLHLSNQRDIADALDDLAQAPNLHVGADAKEVRSALRDRAMRIRASIGDDVRGVNELGEINALGDSRCAVTAELDRWYELKDSAWLRQLPKERQKRSARLTIPLPPAKGALVVRLFLDGAWGSPVRLELDGEVIAECAPDQRDVTFSIPRDPWSVDRIVTLDAHALVSFAHPPIFQSIMLSEGTPGTHFPMVREGEVSPAGALESGMKPDQWSLAQEGSAEMLEPSAQLRLSGPRAGTGVVTLGVSANHPSGDLFVRAGDTPLLTTRLGVSSEINIPVAFATDASVELNFDFVPDASDARFRFEWVSVWMRHSNALERANDAPLMSLGETLSFAQHTRARSVLSDGWNWSGDLPQADAAEATLTFSVPRSARDLILRINLAPLLDSPDGYRHVLGVSCLGQMSATAECLGPGAIDAPLSDIGPDREVTIAIHSVFVGDGEEVVPAAIELSSIELLGEEVSSPDRSIRVPARVPEFQKLISRAKDLLDDEFAGHVGALAEIRTRLCELIATSHDPLPILLAGSPKMFEVLAAIGARTWSVPAATQAPESPLRRILHGVLHGPAFRTPEVTNFDTLPAPLYACGEVFAHWLGAAPELEDHAAHSNYRLYLSALLDAIHRGLDRPGTPAHRLAGTTLMSLNSVRAIFGSDSVRDLITSQSRAIERLLAEQGAPLYTSRGCRSGRERLRVGVFVRDVGPTPEGWALIGSYAGLDRAVFEPVLIRMDQSEDAVDVDDIFERQLVLDGLSPAKAVGAIRQLDLDLFVTGAYVMGWERASSILAHRLATVQIWHTSVCPTTGGFRSFDVALTCDASEPDAPEQTYCEPLAKLPGERQCAYAFGSALPSDAARMRREWGVSEADVVLVSGAMAHKITDDLLRCWSEILAGAPNAKLVLYPYAPNWSMPYAQARFRARCTTAGIPDDRLTVLPTMPPERVSTVLGAADLYLDSFPYTGATTVCEALSTGTPVVTLAGSALRQMTGASWVRAYGLLDLVASNADGYVEIATRLANSASDLAEATGRCAAAAQADPPPHDDRAGVGSALSEALLGIANQHGLGVPQSAMATPIVARPRVNTRKFAIFASPRTGSTLLCAILNRTPGVLCHFELFHQEMIQYRNQTIREVDAISARDEDPIGFLRSAYQADVPDGVDLVGFKHFWHLDKHVTEAILADSDIQIIYLARENLIAQYSSEAIARATGKWVAVTGQPREEVRVAFDVTDFERFERYQRNLERDRLSLLSARGRSAFFIEYRNLLDPSLLKRLSQYLGHQVPLDVKPEILKQNRSHVPDRFSNPTEVKAYLEKRKLLHWLDA